VDLVLLVDTPTFRNSWVMTTNTNRETYLDRVRVESPDGFNYVGTVVREYRDSRGRAVLIEDNQGRERVARPDRPSITVEFLDRDGGEL
jgi:hypothetical protein